jgi:hypothetical protein
MPVFLDLGLDEEVIEFEINRSALATVLWRKS